jgi:thiamine-monophosphate kinase
VNEAIFIDRLRQIATHPAARGLLDDAAVLDGGGAALVLTHDMLVEGVHFLPDDGAADVAWKLVAVNMSDLAAKGAVPLGVLIGAGLVRGGNWAAAFADGLAAALAHFGAPLLGGDTVAMPAGSAVTLGLTAIGAAPASGAPARSGARAGDDLWVSGSIGDAGLGLALRQAGNAGPTALIDAYLRPQPDLALGRALAPLVSAMADVSDGLLIDAQRIAAASGVAMVLALDAVPLSAAWRAVRGDGLDDRIAAATMGDDYRLLFTIAPDHADAIADAGERFGAAMTRIGTCQSGGGLSLTYMGQTQALPAQLGFVHGQ